MATLVFNALGTMVGGPIGGAIGSLVGSQVDAALFGSRNRQGARLKELAVSTSSYGQPVPRHFGRIRTAGSIIWATDLVEHSETIGGGDGSAGLTTYSYTANLAIALASRPILGIGRIWADGKLLRGAQGDLKVQGTMRIYPGHGDQPVDPLLAATEGVDRVPAHRDLAYVVFEDLDLSTFYNRVPGLTFEVLADEAFDLQDLAGDLIDGLDAAVPMSGFAGYTADGSFANDIDILDPVMRLRVDASAERLTVRTEQSPMQPIALAESAIATGDGDFGGASGLSRRRVPPPESPPSILRYFDVQRDYLPGAQRAPTRTGAGIDTGEPRTIELPAALDAVDARAMIERTARRIDWSRERIEWRTSELDPSVAPGAIVTLPGIAGHWLVGEWEWRESGVELSLDRCPPTGIASASMATDPGRVNAPADHPPAQTRLVAFEHPVEADGSNSDAARSSVGVSSDASNWAGCTLFAEAGDGALVPLGPSGRSRAVIGTAISVLPAATPILLDRSGSVEIELVDDAMALRCITLRQLGDGDNLALLGEERVQFSQAVKVAERRWRLSGLMRGLDGTDAMVGTHVAGEPFVLLGSAGNLPIEPDVLARATVPNLVGIGSGDQIPATTSILCRGLAHRPLPPVHPRYSVGPDGTVHLAWTRRARGMTPWQDGAEVPLREDAERYIVTLGPIEQPHAQWSTLEPFLDIAPEAIAGLEASWPGELLHVRQEGTWSVSDPTLLGPLT